MYTNTYNNININRIGYETANDRMVLSVYFNANHIQLMYLMNSF